MKAKMHETSSGNLLAACDKELSNTALKEEEIEFKIRDYFYGKKEIKEKELINKMNEAQSINLIGKKTVSIALKNNFATEKQVKKINKVPHLQIYKI
ncbi:MAG: DUF424 family protein [Candidatus Diapherotrites archaeon]